MAGPDDRMLSRLQVLNEVSVAALEHSSRGGIYQAVAESIVRHFSYFVASVFEVREAEGEAVLVSQSPPRDLAAAASYRQPLAAGLVGVAARGRQSVIANDVSRDARYVPAPGRSVECASELCTPVVKGGVVVAVIDVECCERDAFGESDRLALEAIANMVGLALHAAEVHEALERQLQQLRDAQCQLVMSERLADVGRLTARVAHEIRNPLATIGGFGRRILRVGGPDGKVAEYARVIVDETTRLERLLAGIMNFVRPGQPQKELMDLNAVLRRALHLCEEGRSGKHIRVVEQLDPDLPLILADAKQLEEVFMHLIRNAYDSIAGEGAVEVGTRRADGMVLVSLSDTGSGIPPDQLARVFDPFFTTKPGGAGLGLTVASKIIDDHGGRIVLGSEPGKGTHVRVHLPIGEAAGGLTRVAQPIQ